MKAGCSPMLALVGETMEVLIETKIREGKLSDQSENRLQ